MGWPPHNTLTYGMATVLPRIFKDIRGNTGVKGAYTHTRARSHTQIHTLSNTHTQKYIFKHAKKLKQQRTQHANIMYV